jgi:putative ABC transport system permease protein
MRDIPESPRPPRVARLFLFILLHPSDRDPALADLDEEFEARATQEGAGPAARWYRTQVRRSVWPAIERRMMRLSGRPPVVTELRWAWRAVRARRAAAVMHAALVALAVGASGIVFAAADAFVFRRAPYPNVDRLVVFQRASPVGVIDVLDSNEYRTLSQRPDLFAAMFLHSMGPTPLVPQTGGIDSVRVHDVDPGLFDALGVRPRWGRPLGPGDELPGREPVALLREDFARIRFGDPAAAIDQTIELENERVRVVGVMPGGFRFPNAIEKIWRPLAAIPPGRDRMGPAVAVLAPHADVTAVSTVVEGLVNPPGKPVASLGPVHLVPMGKAQKDPRAYTNSGAFTSFDAPRLFTMLTAVAICLAAIVWLNVAGLTLASALERIRIYSLQSVLGATRAMLIRASVFENAIPTATGALAGAGLAIWGTSALAAALPPALGSLLANPIDIDYRAAAVMAAIAITGAIVTSVPAVWWATRPALADRLRHTGPSATMSRTQVTARYVLMTGQMSLTVVLLVLSVLLVRSYVARRDQDKGFDSAALATIEVRQPAGTSRKPAELDRAILSRLRSSSVVDSIARTGRLPPGLRGGNAADLWIEGSATPAGQVANTHFEVDPEYFQTMGIRLLAGRFTVAGDSSNQVVVDAEFARRFFPNGDPIGARYWTGRPEPPKAGPYEIVGVASRVRLDTSQVPMGGDVYVVHRTLPAGAAPLSYVVRLPAADRLADVAALVRSIAPDSLVRTRLMEDRYAEVYGDSRIAAGLTGGFALIAFPVAMVGLYGVTAVIVASRTREIGIRLALGAGKPEIRRLVIGPAMRFLAAGVILGVVVAVLASRSIESQLHGVKPVDPALYVAVAIAIGATAFVATWRPARRALRVDPIITLRTE